MGAKLSRLERKIIEQARLVSPFCTGGRCKHISLLVRRSTIKSIGVNTFQTDPLSARFGYRYANKHSELVSIKNYNYRRNATPIHHCTMYNIRFRANGNVSFSFPCSHCLELLDAFEITRVMYTGDDGFFHSWNEPIQESWYSVMKQGKIEANKPLVLPVPRGVRRLAMPTDFHSVQRGS